MNAQANIAETVSMDNKFQIVKYLSLWRISNTDPITLYQN